MKGWFPLTSYEFYAYITAGIIVLASFDRCFFDSYLASRADWKAADYVFWTAIAYLIGQIIAIPSSALLEHWLAKHVLHDPSMIILGLKEQRTREFCFGTILGAREYEPFPNEYRKGIVAKLAYLLDLTDDKIYPDAALQCAFVYARSIPDTIGRLDNFINQYGLCRNASFASFVSGAFLIWRSLETRQRVDAILAATSMALALGMFARFIKFYSAYTREVYRGFDKAYVIPAVRKL